jgi:hypothetical protein
MKTILEALKSEHAVLATSDKDHSTWIAWDGDHMEWAVYHWPREGGPPNEVLTTQDESEAVAAFAKAAGIED